jgi:multidrug resistance efflux pump
MAILNTLHTSEFQVHLPRTSEPGPARGLARRAVRIGLLVAFLLTGMLFLYLKAFRNASLDGVVNAPKYVVRAPIEGTFQVVGLGTGSSIVAGEAVATITNDRLDDRLEAELSTKASRLTREIAAQETVRSEIAAVRNRLGARLEELRETNLRKYEEVTGETMNRAKRLRVIADSSHQDLERFAVLAEAGVETPLRIEEYRRAYIRNESESETAARAASRSLIDREAAGKGYFLGEAVWDVPYTQQRLDEIDILSLHVRLRSEVLAAELAEVKERLARERARMAGLRQATVRSQSAAMVSTLLVGDGFEVIKGDALMEILDLSRTYVEATFPESRYERLRRGATVRVKFADSAALLHGTIVSVRGPGAIDPSAADAARLRSVSQNELILTVALEPEDLERVYGPTPQIGRRAQIFFD